jgi:hypothetical protein
MPPDSRQPSFGEIQKILKSHVRRTLANLVNILLYKIKLKQTPSFLNIRVFL